MNEKGLVGQYLITYTKNNGDEGWVWYFDEEEVVTFLGRNKGKIIVHNIIRIKDYEQMDVKKLWDSSI